MNQLCIRGAARTSVVRQACRGRDGSMATLVKPTQLGYVHLTIAVFPHGCRGHRNLSDKNCRPIICQPNLIGTMGVARTAGMLAAVTSLVSGTLRLDDRLPRGWVEFILNFQSFNHGWTH